MFTQILPAFMTISSLLAFLISAFRDKRRFRNALFMLSMFISAFFWLLQIEHHTIISRFLLLTGVILILVFIFIIPLLLIGNGFQMIKKEGFCLPNLLSLLFSVLIFLGEAALIPSFFHIIEIQQQWFYLPLNIFGAVVLYISLIFVAFLLYSSLIQILPRRIDYDYIIVLGAGLQDGEKPTPLLKDRLNKAIQVYHRSLSACHIIVSGGQGTDENISEAEAMRRYLLQHNILNRDILIEDQSTSTKENIMNSFAIIDSRKGRSHTAIISSGYHVYRALIYCRSSRDSVTAIGAHTALYYWPSAMIREYAALIYLYLPHYLIGIIFFIIVFLYLFT